MKLPNNTTLNKKSVNNDVEKVEIIVDKPEKFYHTFEMFQDEKELKRYIKKIESMIRGSLEYRSYITYLKEEKNLTSCKFFSEVDKKEIKNVGIEFHHYPFNLYELTETVLKKNTDNYFHSANVFDVCDEVMHLHYKNQVGLVPLSVTIHELAHAGEIFIPLTLVYGDVNKFIDDYNDYISDELFSSLDILKDLTNKNNLDVNKYILKKKFQEIIMEDRKIEPIISPNNEIKLA